MTHVPRPPRGPYLFPFISYLPGHLALVHDSASYLLSNHLHLMDVEVDVG